MVDDLNNPFEFDQWRVDPRTNVVCGRDKSFQLPHRTILVLSYLASRGNQLVLREELIDALWQGNYSVGNRALTNAVWMIREALGDDDREPRYIQTVPRRGYRFLADRRANEKAARRPGSRKSSATALVLLFVVVLLVGIALNFPGKSPVGGGLPLSHVEKVTELPGIEDYPVASPNGRYLAFTQRSKHPHELRIRDLQNQTERTLQDSGWVGRITWSADGEHLAWAAIEDGQCRIKKAQIVSLTVDVVADCALTMLSGLDWSPVGETLVFSRYDRSTGQGGLVISGTAAGAETRFLTQQARGEGFIDQVPVWSTDGQGVYFVRPRSPGFHDILKTDLNGRVETLLKAEGGVASITPLTDGESIIFWTYRAGVSSLRFWQPPMPRSEPLPLDLPGDFVATAPRLTANGELYAVRTHSRRQLAAIPLDDGEAAPGLSLPTSLSAISSPGFDGDRWLYYTLASDFTFELWRTTLNGALQEQLNVPGRSHSHPVVSPDGLKLAYSSVNQTTGLGEVYVVNTSDWTTILHLADATAGRGAPSWAPDSDAIYSARENEASWQMWRIDLGGGEVRLDIPAVYLQESSSFRVYFNGNDRSLWLDGDEEPQVQLRSLVEWGGWLLHDNTLIYPDRNGSATTINRLDLNTRQTVPIAEANVVIPGWTPMTIVPGLNQLIVVEAMADESDIVRLDLSNLLNVMD